MGRTVTDLDERDLAARDRLRLDLIQARLDAGLSQRAVAHAMGRQASMVRQLEAGMVLQSRTGTVVRWASALGRKVTIEPVGFPAPVRGRPPSRSTDVDDLLTAMTHTMPADLDDWVAARVAADLVGIRIACGISQPVLADALGITEQAVSIFETSGADTALAVLQRYARALARCTRRTDAHLHVRVHVG